MTIDQKKILSNARDLANHFDPRESTVQYRHCSYTPYYRRPSWYGPTFVTHNHYYRSDSPSRVDKKNKDDDSLPIVTVIGLVGVGLTAIYFLGKQLSSTYEIQDYDQKLVNARDEFHNDNRMIELIDLQRDLLTPLKEQKQNRLFTAQTITAASIVGLVGAFFASPTLLTLGVVGIGTSTMHYIYQLGYESADISSMNIASELHELIDEIESKQ